MIWKSTPGDIPDILLEGPHGFLYADDLVFVLMLTVAVVVHAGKDRSEELEAFLGPYNIMITSQIQSTDIVVSLSGYPDS